MMKYRTTRCDPVVPVANAFRLSRLLLQLATEIPARVRRKSLPYDWTANGRDPGAVDALVIHDQADVRASIVGVADLHPAAHQSVAFRTLNMEANHEVRTRA